MRTTAIFLVLVAMTSAAHVSQAATSTSTDREVITVDNGPRHRLTIVRDPGGAGPTPSAQGPQVLAYRTSAGAWVRAYADHPVSRTEVETQILAAQGRAEKARAQGRLAAEAGRRAAAEGRRLAQAAKQEASGVREASLRSAQEGRREAELGRREAERAQAESEQAIKEARREMEQLSPDASADQPWRLWASRAAQAVFGSG